MKLLGFFLAFMHGLVIVLGMLGLMPGNGSPIFPFTYWYQRFTGAGGGFGFYSPNIAREPVVVFEVTTATGEKFPFRFQDHVPDEVTVRVNNMFRLIMKEFSEDDVVRSVAASMAAAVFKEVPAAVLVRLEVLVHRIPTMEETRAGVPPSRKRIYSAEFRRPQ